MASVEKDANHALRPFLVESVAKYVTYILNCMGISGEANAPLGLPILKRALRVIEVMGRRLRVLRRAMIRKRKF